MQPVKSPCNVVRKCSLDHSATILNVLLLSKPGFWRFITGNRLIALGLDVTDLGTKAACMGR